MFIGLYANGIMPAGEIGPCVWSRCVPSFHLDIPNAAWAARARAAVAPDVRSSKADQADPQGSAMTTHRDPSGMAPYHAHVYYDASTRPIAEVLRQNLIESMQRARIPPLRFVGRLSDRSAGPHPLPQFEIHFTADGLAAIRDIIASSGLTALVHPLTDDDLADHTSLAQWIGRPLALDLSTLDPPGHNQGVARFGKSDF